MINSGKPMLYPKSLIAIFLSLISTFSVAGSYLAVTVYQIGYTASQNPLELVPVRVIADMGEYRYGYAVFAKWMQPIQNLEGSGFEYKQSNVAHIRDLEIDVIPKIGEKTVSIILDFKKVKRNFLAPFKDVGFEDLINLIGHAAYYTYGSNSPGKIETVVITVKNMPGAKKFYRFDESSVDPRLNPKGKRDW